MNNILYEKIENVCARDFTVCNFSYPKFTAFVEKIYKDMSNWEKPLELAERDIINRVEQHVSYAMNRSVDDAPTGINND